MALQDFSHRFRLLAGWLSLLALCAALLAPAAVLAEEMRTGKWTGLCGASLSDKHSGHAQGEGVHCELCALPVLGLGRARAAFSAFFPLARPGVMRGGAVPDAAPARPSIRGPPFLS